MSTSDKNAALAKVANGANIVSAGNAKVRIGKAVVHLRFCSRNLRKRRFNRHIYLWDDLPINPARATPDEADQFSPARVSA